jgi:hypothetical protein
MRLHRTLAEAIEAEFRNANESLTAGDVSGAFRHLERAHVLGQKHTPAHVRAHWAMLKYACRYGRARDVAGQTGRLLGAALFTWAWVPEGNTGGTNISAFQRLPIPPELRQVIDG